ncbi:MAG: hypothetical protein M1814_006638 [Vezdaea aestivalis]|nr:MAG: hypothetical protein M1814_006638 [Vezdaea aestivalis]
MGLASLLEDALTFVAESLPLGEAFAEEAAKEEGEGDSEEEDEESKEGEEIQSEEAEEPAAEEEAGEEEEEEEDEPVDPKPALEEGEISYLKPSKTLFLLLGGTLLRDPSTAMLGEMEQY